MKGYVSFGVLVALVILIVLGGNLVARWDYYFLLEKEVQNTYIISYEETSLYSSDDVLIRSLPNLQSMFQLNSANFNLHRVGETKIYGKCDMLRGSCSIWFLAQDAQGERIYTRRDYRVNFSTQYDYEFVGREGSTLHFSGTLKPFNEVLPSLWLAYSAFLLIMAVLVTVLYVFVFNKNNG